MTDAFGDIHNTHVHVLPITTTTTTVNKLTQEHGALLRLLGVVQIQYLPGTRSLNALPAGYSASYSLQA